jgi:hypothetical protein
MCTDREDLCIYQGNDQAWVVTVTLEDGVTPADIAGYTASAQIRRGVADSDPVVVTSFTTAVVSPDVSLSLSHDQTGLLSGRYVWDLLLTSPADIRTTILRGNVAVTATVTRSVAPLMAVMSEAA